MTDIVQQVSEQAPQLGPKIFSGLIILLIFWTIGIITEKITIKVGEKANIHKDIIRLIGRIGRITFIVLGLVSALGTVGINVSALVASLGLTGFALGFALKDALSNVLSGALILIYSPFDCDDTIKVAGYEGKVIEIDLRYTTLKTADGRVLIPNSKLFVNPVVIKDQV